MHSPAWHLTLRTWHCRPPAARARRVPLSKLCLFHLGRVAAGRVGRRDPHPRVRLNNPAVSGTLVP